MFVLKEGKSVEVAIKRLEKFRARRILSDGRHANTNLT